VDQPFAATRTGMLILAVTGAVGQAERESMMERQHDGMPGRIALTKAQDQSFAAVRTGKRHAVRVYPPSSA
jgi:hypothetical protein